MKICFFAARDYKTVKSTFHGTDIKILHDLGHKVNFANSFLQIPSDTDLIFAWWASSGYQAVLRSKLMKKPCVLVSAGFDVCSSKALHDGFEYRPFYHRLLIKWALKNSSKIISVSDEVKKNVFRISGLNSNLIFNCVDTNAYKRDLRIRKENVVLTVGGLAKYKNHELIIKAAPNVLKKYPNAKFVFVGSFGREYDKLKKLAFDLDVAHSVDFAGFVGEKRKLELLNKAKVYVQPSFYESFCVALAEAMSCNLPVIVSNKGAIKEVVADSGIYTSISDSEELAKNIIRLLGSSSLRQKLGNKARKRVVENFSYKVRKEKIRKILEQLTNWDDVRNSVN